LSTRVRLTTSFHPYTDPPTLHTFPTRRSSDLGECHIPETDLTPDLPVPDRTGILFLFGVDDPEDTFRAGNRRQHLVELIGEIGERPRELPGIFSKDDNGPDRHYPVGIDPEAAAATRASCEADVVEHVHHFRDETGV